MASSETSGTFHLGIDTGGTYTDAVLWSSESGLAAKAKALTTRHDMTVGISEAAQRVIASSGIAPSRIDLVSMSTTLATNALVEGHGEPAALVMIGFDGGDINKAGLAAALGTDPLIRCPGGHNVHGSASQLDLAPLELALPGLQSEVAAVAICAYFAVRNPEHEIAARELVAARSGLPVTCSHELSSNLGGPKRALTTLLNARLVSTITRLVDATRAFLAKSGIEAPLMIVRGNGALVRAEFAIDKPIETILSGPAASVVGARYLTGCQAAIVSDIGGTTTDIAILQEGQPRIDPDGAVVGGYRTMVEAVAMHTFGLGGDSEIRLEEGGLSPKLLIGPRRQVPLALCARLHPDEVLPALESQLRNARPGRLDGRFALVTGVGRQSLDSLQDRERQLLNSLGDGIARLDRVLTSTSQTALFERLVTRGLVRIGGFTPSDAAHVMGRQSNWNRDAAVLGAELFSRKRDGAGRAIAGGAEDLSRRVLDAVTRRSAEAILETVFSEDGIDGPAAVRQPLVQYALDGKNSIGRLSVKLDRPVIGLGASAPLHYSNLGALAGGEVIIPPDSDVANALGAVVGHVSITAEAHVSLPQPGRFRVSTASGVTDHESEADAIAAAESAAEQHALDKAVLAGATSPAVKVARNVTAATVEGERTFIEAHITVTATGRPRIASE